eukprot:GEMP01002379.1.p1 GENE.GEMP01002379.1~~GEMP01002379.1.p1  ORF type:complete len:1250 (+),score=322.31 GEMP01002379.1:88-3837(+)
MSAKRVLVCGDVDGDLEKLYNDVSRQQAQHGKFDILIACGKFLPTQKAQQGGLQVYLSGEKEVPIKTYFVDSDSGVFMHTAHNGRKIGETNIDFLGSFGVQDVDGLRVGYISGRMGDEYENAQYHDDGKPAHVNGQYTRATIEAMKLLAQDGPLDILVSSEWPLGLENHTSDPAVDPEFSSSAITELCQAFEPRFHIFSLAGQFHRRQAYLAPNGGHVCRPVGLGKVGMKGKEKKCLHALIIVPFSQCTPASLQRGESEAGPCPFPLEAVKVGVKRTRPLVGAPATKLPRQVQEQPNFNVRKDGMKWVLDIHFGKGRRMAIETGEVFKQAGGAVVVRDGETQVWGTCCASKEPTDKDFLPLTVEYKERSSAAGKTPGGFIKRDKPMCEDHEILVCRFTDRPLRPLFPDTWSNETQILLFTMCYDEIHPPEPLAICAAAASVFISDIPIKRPIAGVMVVMTESGEYLVNPTVEERRAAKMQVMVAGTTEAVSMIEMSGDFVTEAQFLDGVMVAHDAIKLICQGLIAFDQKAGKPKQSADNAIIPPALPTIIDRKYGQRVDHVLRNLLDVSATEHEEKVSAIEKEALKELGPSADGTEKPLEFKKKDIVKAFKKMSSLRMMKFIQQTGKRIDGRRIDEVRNIDVKQRYLSKCHGTSLFTRGDTQTIATCTLGDSGMRQRVESIVDPEKKRFYLQYFFPPSCVGDVRRMTKGRREVGHGNLAERAVRPSIPEEKDFPYSIRTESFITESCGSSSMASVCGVSLAMVDAGVPVKCLVSGVAMGLVDLSSGVASDDAIVLSDIAELEDFIGKMDFKVAGNETGISAVQLDVKNEGLTRKLFARALDQARTSRLYILDEMKKHVTLDDKVELPPNVPRILRIAIAPDAKGKIIGPGGSNIRKMIEEFKLTNINVSDDNFCEISGTDSQVLQTVKMIIEDIQQGAGGGRGMTNPNTPKITMSLPPNGKGKLIGRGGQTINGLIQEFGLADIKIHDDTNSVDLFGNDEGKLLACKVKIEALYEQGPGGAPAGRGAPFGGHSHGPAGKPDDSMDVPKARLGRVIGRGGSTIKALIDEFDLTDMKARDVNGEGVVEFYGGTDESRAECMEKVRNLVSDEPTAGGPMSVPKHVSVRPPGVVGGLRPMRPFSALTSSSTPAAVRPPFGSTARPNATSTAAIVPKVKSGPPKGPSGIKVSEDLKVKLQMEFAEMCPGDSKTYRLLPHEVKLAKDLAAAFEMTIDSTGTGGEFVVTRQEDEGF